VYPSLGKKNEDPRKERRDSTIFSSAIILDLLVYKD
jgi:hypothetical protein